MIGSRYPNLKAFASLTLDGSFLDIAHPVTREMRDRVQTQVLEAYRKTAEAG